RTLAERGDASIGGDGETRAVGCGNRSLAGKGVDVEGDDLSSAGAGDRPASAAAKCQPDHLVAEAAMLRDGPAVLTPDANGAVLAAGDHIQSIRRERDGVQATRRRTEGRFRLAGVGIPDFDI